MSFDGVTGANPLSALIEGSDGHLYGTASGGGVSNFGTIFRLNKDGRGYTVLRDFVDGAQDGKGPLGLIEGREDGVLYGATEFGGQNLGGVVFKLNKDGSGFQILHAFTVGTQDGSLPFDGVLEGSDGGLYGTTYNGGSNSFGTIFRLNKDGSGYTQLRSFAYPEGANPTVSLSEGTNGTLFGTTYIGGDRGAGTIYKLNRDGSGFTVLHSFQDVDASGDGYYPRGRPLQASDGLLYGTATSGGTNSGGIVYRLNTDGTGYGVLHRFSGTGTQDGAGPWGSLVEGLGGAMYGTTYGGGELNFGTVFRLNRDGSAYAVLWSFNSYFVPGKDGAYPQTGLTQSKDGSLYGTTDSGGASDMGTVFRLFSATPSLLMTGISFQQNATILSVAGAGALESYSIQARTNLDTTDSWRVIGLSTSGIDGAFQFIDTNASNHVVRFYRTATP